MLKLLPEAPRRTHIVTRSKFNNLSDILYSCTKGIISREEKITVILKVGVKIILMMVR